MSVRKNSLTAQEIFDQVVNHLRKQGCKSRRLNPDWISGSDCLYRGPNGTKCAAGCLIRDEEYHPSMEGMSIGWIIGFTQNSPFSLRERLGAHISLITSLQIIHDKHEVVYWEDRFESLAIKFSLKYSPPEAQ